MAGDKTSTSLRLESQTRGRIDEIAGWYGISINEVVDLAVACLHVAGPPRPPEQGVIMGQFADLGIKPTEVQKPKRGRPRSAPPEPPPPVEPPPKRPRGRPKKGGAT